MYVPSLQGSSWTNRDVALFCATIAALALVPWVVPYFPTQDGPNHLAVAHILIHYKDPGAPFRDYWTIDPGFPPSTLYYRFLVAIGPHIGLLAAEKLMLSVTVAALPLSVWFFLKRVVPARSKNVFLVLPLVLGWALAMGFLSYVLGLALGYVVLALAYASPGEREHDAGPGPRHVVAAVLHVVCAYLHPVVSVLIGAALLLLYGSKRLSGWPTLRNVVVVTAPAALLTARALFSAPAAVEPHAVTRWPSFGATLSGLVEYQVAYSRWELLPRGAALVVLFGCAIAGFGANPPREGTAERAVARVVVTFIVLYAVMPQVLADWWYCSARFLLLGAFLLPAVAVVPEGLAEYVPTLGVALTVGVLLAMSTELARLGTELENVVATGASLSRGAKLISLDFWINWGAIDKPAPLTHAWAWLVVDRDALAPNVFAAGRPGMGGERFRTLAFRAGVLDVASGTLPWPSSESTYHIVSACKEPSSVPCLHALAARNAAIDAVSDRYQALLMIAPPSYARESLAKGLRLVQRTGDVFLYAFPPKAGLGREALPAGPATQHQATAARM